MTATDIVTILAAVGVLIGIVAQQVINVMNARAVRLVQKEIASVVVETKAITATTARIDGHVNSEKTAAEGRENLLKRENELLRDAMTEQKERAALLAQAAATAPSVMQAGVIANGTADKHLEQIEDHTEATAANTARTDASVEQLKAEQ